MTLPSKQHQDNTPVQHLNTLKGNTVSPIEAKKKVTEVTPVGPAPSVRQETVTPRKTQSGTGGGAEAGLAIGAVVSFLLLRTVL